MYRFIFVFAAMIISNAIFCFGQNTDERYEIALDSIKSSLNLDYGAFTISDTVYDMREIVFSFPKKEIAKFPDDSTKLAEVFSFENMISNCCRPPQRCDLLAAMKRMQDDNAPMVIFFSHLEDNCLIALAIEETDYTKRLARLNDYHKHRLKNYIRFNSGTCFWFIFDNFNNVLFCHKQKMIYD